MKRKFLEVVLISSILVCSCRTYLDVKKNSVSTNYMSFEYKKDYNELDYFNKVNASADQDIYYTTHFKMKLPKKIVYWKRVDNKFYFEYDSKQIIYVYAAYKNEGKESDKWELKNIERGSEVKYLSDYWASRKYDESYLKNTEKNTKTQIYSNGKYDILLYNVKQNNFDSYLEFVKSFTIKE